VISVGALHPVLGQGWLMHAPATWPSEHPVVAALSAGGRQRLAGGYAWASTWTRSPKTPHALRPPFPSCSSKKGNGGQGTVMARLGSTGLSTGPASCTSSCAKPEKRSWWLWILANWIRAGNLAAGSDRPIAFC